MGFRCFATCSIVLGLGSSPLATALNVADGTTYIMEADSVWDIVNSKTVFQYQTVFLHSRIFFHLKEYQVFFANMKSNTSAFAAMLLLAGEAVASTSSTSLASSPTSLTDHHNRPCPDHIDPQRTTCFPRVRHADSACHWFRCCQLE